jgi:hypothetical protein
MLVVAIKKRHATIECESAEAALAVLLIGGQDPRERERVCELPRGVAFLPKPWQPFNVLVVAGEALAYAQGRS